MEVPTDPQLRGLVFSPPPAPTQPFRFPQPLLLQLSRLTLLSCKSFIPFYDSQGWVLLEKLSAEFHGKGKLYWLEVPLMDCCAMFRPPTGTGFTQATQPHVPARTSLLPCGREWECVGSPENKWMNHFQMVHI